MADNHKKDEIILQQLEVIRTMTEHNLSRMGSDFWGAPAPAPGRGAFYGERRQRHDTAKLY